MHPFIQRAAATVAAPLACAFLAANTLCLGADSTVEKPASTVSPGTPANAHEAELEAKIKRLEKRIDDLENQSEQRARPDNDQQIQSFRNRMKRDLSNNFDDLFDQMRRELEQGMNGLNNGGLQFDFGPQAGGPFGGRANAEKPRLGVQLAPATDELRERFKNDVKQGAFVIAVVPESPAEKAGIMVGDAITTIAGKSVADPKAAMDAIRSAPNGKTDIAVTRQGKDLALKVDLAEAADNTSLDNYVQGQANAAGGGRWLRRRDMNNGNRGAAPGANGNNANANGAVQSRTELKASALEMTDELATSLKLTDDQRTKMAEVLHKEAQKASDEASAGAKPQAFGRGGIRLDMNESANIGRIVDKHVVDAEDALKNVLNADQMRDWKEYRKAHSSVQFSHSMTLESGDGSTGSTTGGDVGF